MLPKYLAEVGPTCIRLMSLLRPGLQSMFVAHSNIYLGFTGKVPSLTHFPLELGCEDYSFVDHAVANFEEGFDSILTDCPDNITLTPAKRKADQSVRMSDWHRCCWSCYLNMEQLISHFWVVLADTISSLPEFKGRIIHVSGVHELLIKTHEILDNAVSKWVGNSADTLAPVFNFASRQCPEIWASQFPFLHILQVVVSPSEACLYGHINWSLAQDQQQASIGLSQSFLSKIGGKTKPWTGLHFSVQKRPVPVSSGASLAKRPHLESGTETHPGGKKSAGSGVSASSADGRKKGDCGVSTPDVSQSTASSSRENRSIMSYRIVLHMVQCHHLQLRSHPPLFCNFWQFNVKVAAAHHPIIQMEVDELLSKGVIEPSSGDAGFDSSMFVVPKHTDGLWPILNFQQFNHYLHIPSFKMPTFWHVLQLIQHGNYAFSIDLQVFINIFLLLSIIIGFYNLFGTIHHISGRFLPFGLATTPRVSQPSLNLSVLLPLQGFPYCYQFGWHLGHDSL